MTKSTKREAGHHAAQVEGASASTETPVRRILSVRQVLEIRGGSRSKLYRDVKDGKFCVPVETGDNSIGFYSDEVAANINSLPRVPYAPAPEPSPADKDEAAPQPSPLVTSAAAAVGRKDPAPKAAPA